MRQGRVPTDVTSWPLGIEYNVILLYIKSFWPLGFFDLFSSAHLLLVFLLPGRPVAVHQALRGLRVRWPALFGALQGPLRSQVVYFENTR